MIKRISWYEWLLIIALPLLVIVSFQVRRMSSESSRIYPFTSNELNLHFRVNSEQVEAVKRDLERLLSANGELVTLEENEVSERFNLKKIVLADYSKGLDEVTINSKIEIKASLDDGENCYMWVSYNYVIVDKQTKKQLIKKEGIERLYLNGETGGGAKVTIESGISIPSHQQAFYGI